jgi:hypothetical protein
MGTFKLVLGFVVIVLVAYSGFQIAPVEMANYSFEDDLKQVALVGASTPTKTDDDLRNMVVLKAKDHDIQLTPEQVTVQRIGTPGAPAVYVAADYNSTVNLPGYSYTFHFTPSSGNKGF